VKIVTQDNDYEELKEKVKKFRRAESISESITLIWFFIIVLPPIVAAIVSFLLNFVLPSVAFYLLMGVGFVLGLLVFRWKNRQLELYRVESAEWLNYYVYPAATNLQRYLFKKNATPSMKETYRKKAIKNLNELATAIRIRWTVGNFRLAKDAVGTSVSDLLNSLDFWVIPTLEEEGRKKDEEKIKRVEAFATSLYWLSKHLDLKELIEINSRCRGNYTIPSAEEKKGLWQITKSSRNVKWIVPTAVVIVAFIVSVYYLTAFERWSIVDACTAAGAFYGIILAAVTLFRRGKD
jgi:hypothetical protein